MRLPTPRVPGKEGYLFLDGFLQRPRNVLPPRHYCEATDAIAADLPADHPVVHALAAFRFGGIPMTDSTTFPHAGWSRLQAVADAARPLQLAGAAAARAGDYRAACVYARATLNAGRAIGDMPRLLAQETRNAQAVRAACLVTQMMAWGEPDEDGLAELQGEFLAEADRPWLKAVLRGERAVLDRVVPNFSPDDEAEQTYYPGDRTNRPRPPITWEDRASLFAIRPYRDECLAEVLRELTRAAAACDLPPPERWAAWKEMKKRDFGQSILTRFQKRWWLELSLAGRVANSHDDEQCALLRATAATIACERFRRINGRWPNGLAEIPAAILPAIPADPFDGQPLRYRVVPGGAIVYSIGPKPPREGAEVDLAYDLGAPLCDVSLRRKPSPFDPLDKAEEVDTDDKR